MVVVQVCCRLSRTIFVVSAAALPVGAASPTEAAAGATDAVFRKLRRFISVSDLLQSPGGHQQFGPIGIVEVVDAHHRGQVGGGVDEFSLSEIDASVDDLLFGSAEEQQVAGLRMLAIHAVGAVEFGLRLRGARQGDTAAARPGSEEHTSGLQS